MPTVEPGYSTPSCARVSAAIRNFIGCSNRVWAPVRANTSFRPAGAKCCVRRKAVRSFGIICKNALSFDYHPAPMNAGHLHLLRGDADTLSVVTSDISGPQHPINTYIWRRGDHTIVIDPAGDYTEGSPSDILVTHVQE